MPRSAPLGADLGKTSFPSVFLGLLVCFFMVFLVFSVLLFDLHGVFGGLQGDLQDLYLSLFLPLQRGVLPPNQFLNVFARFGSLWRYHLHFSRLRLSIRCPVAVADTVSVTVAVNNAVTVNKAVAVNNAVTVTVAVSDSVTVNGAAVAVTVKDAVYVVVNTTVTVPAPTTVDVTIVAAVSVTDAAAVNVTVSSMATKVLPICCLNNHLGLFMWVMVGFGEFFDGYLSVITSYIWEIRRFFFMQDSDWLLLRISLLASYGDVCNNRRVRVLYELMDHTNTSLFRVLCTDLVFCALFVLIWDPISLSFRYGCRHRRFHRQLHHQCRLQRRHQCFCYRFSPVYGDKGFPNFFPRRGNLVESVGCGGAIQSLFISLVFVDLFLVFEDNSSQSFRWILVPIYFEGSSTYTPMQKSGVGAIRKGRPFPRIVGARWYLFMSYPEAFKTTLLGLHMWEMVRFEDLGYSLCSLYLPPKAVSSFLNSDSLVIFSYLATVIRLGDSLPLLSCLLIYLQVTDGSTTTYKTTLQNFWLTGYLEVGCLIGSYSVLSTIYRVLVYVSSLMRSIRLASWFYCFFLAYLDGALLYLTTSVLALVLLLRWWWKRILVEVWLWCDSSRGYLLRPDRSVLGVCQFFKIRPSYRWSASSPNLTCLSLLVSAIRRLIWLLFEVYPQLIVLYFYLAALPLLAITSYIDFPTCFGTFGFLGFLLCIMGINVIVNTYDINK